MGLLRHGIPPFVLLSLIIFSAVSAAEQPPAAPVSQCVCCHTDVKGLIRLGWEIEKIRGKPAVSAETVGEG